jgi:acid phosphatase class B
MNVIRYRGYYAGKQYQAPYSIVLNASSSKTVNAGTTGFFVSPVRNIAGTTYLVYNATTNEITHSAGAPSDYRIKENVRSLDNTFKVDYLNPVTYFNKENKTQDIGLIAHELQEHYPQLVYGEKDSDELQCINYNGLIPVLINEIKNMKNEIKTINEELKNVKEELSQIKMN